MPNIIYIFYNCVDNKYELQFRLTKNNICFVYLKQIHILDNELVYFKRISGENNWILLFSLSLGDVDLFFDNS